MNEARLKVLLRTFIEREEEFAEAFNYAKDEVLIKQAQEALGDPVEPGWWRDKRVHQLLHAGIMPYQTSWKNRDDQKELLAFADAIIEDHEASNPEIQTDLREEIRHEILDDVINLIQVFMVSASITKEERKVVKELRDVVKELRDRKA
jgi:hypothetical protein